MRRFQIYSTEAALPSHLSLLRLLRVHPGRLVKILFQFDYESIKSNSFVLRF